MRTIGIRAWTTGFGVMIALSVMAIAQDAPPESPILRTGTKLVLVPVTVTDKKGNLIDGLTEEDFALSDAGVKQKIHLDTSDTIVAPVSLVVAVQCSGISQPIIAKINKVGAMIQPLLIGDRGKAAVIAYDDEIHLLQDFTSDGTKIRIAFQKIEGRRLFQGRTIDATAKAIEMLATRPESSRRILIILSESRDRGSKAKLPEVVKLAQQTGVLIYPATYSVHAAAWTAKPEDAPAIRAGSAYDIDYWAIGIELFRKGKVNAAQVLAASTGGRHLSFETLKGLEEVIARAGEEIHSQYLLSFVPSATPGFHPLTVGITSRPDAIVRARPGYWAQ